MPTATFFHAGCPVCISAEQRLAAAIDPGRYDLEVVHLAEHPDEIARAEQAGVRSVPALVMDGEVFHINHGADLADLRA
ncbi:MAG: thioredoxin family protein [Thermoleophilia bacterium]|jgi:glutaredoxin|nr:thioredoxin family protein [Thermoleophilia bacterium]